MYRIMVRIMITASSLILRMALIQIVRHILNSRMAHQAVADLTVMSSCHDLITDRTNSPNHRSSFPKRGISNEYPIVRFVCYRILLRDSFDSSTISHRVPQSPEQRSSHSSQDHRHLQTHLLRASGCPHPALKRRKRHRSLSGAHRYRHP